MTDEDLKAAREKFGRLGHVTIDGVTHSFRKPTRPEWDDYSGNVTDPDLKLKAMRGLVLLCCVSDPAALSRAIEESPYNLQGRGGFLACVNKLAGENCAETRFD